MKNIDSHAKDYSIMQGYLTPQQVEQLATTPQTTQQHALYSAAHCFVSERHGKGDLVDMVYALLRTHHENPQNAYKDILQHLADCFSRVAKCENCPCHTDGCKKEKKKGNFKVCANRIINYASFLNTRGNK